MEIICSGSKITGNSITSFSASASAGCCCCCCCCCSFNFWRSFFSFFFWAALLAASSATDASSFSSSALQLFNYVWIRKYAWYVNKYIDTDRISTNIWHINNYNSQLHTMQHWLYTKILFVCDVFVTFVCDCFIFVFILLT